MSSPLETVKRLRRSLSELDQLDSTLQGDFGAARLEAHAQRARVCVDRSRRDLTQILALFEQSSEYQKALNERTKEIK